MLLDIDTIKDVNSKEFIAKTLLYYFSKNYVIYDSSRDELSIISGEGPAKQMVRHALLALGARETERPEGKGKVIVYAEHGARKVALKLKDFGLNFKGAGDLPECGASR